LDPRARRLFSALKELRGEIAKREHVPAFVVFTDRTLLELAVTRPQSKAAMLEVYGVGETRLARFGERFLHVIQSDRERDVS
jgi:ATP-dependent DNA helicase RecQ